jgi:hypothetical protein
VSLEDPSFSSGYYNLYRNRGVEDGYTLVFERPRSKKEDQSSRLRKAEGPGKLGPSFSC